MDQTSSIEDTDHIDNPFVQAYRVQNPELSNPQQRNSAFLLAKIKIMEAQLQIHQYHIQTLENQLDVRQQQQHPFQHQFEAYDYIIPELSSPFFVYKASISIESASSAKADSGAEVSIASYNFISSFGLPVQPLSPPLHIIFGNGSKSQSHHFVSLGALGTVYLVDDAVDALLSVNSITNNGFRVLLTSSSITIQDKDGRDIFTQQKAITDSLWSIHIPKAIEACQHQLTDASLSTPSAHVQAARVKHRIPSSTVALAFHLHQIWQHAHPHIMEQMFKPFNPFPMSSPFSILDADTIRIIFQHRPCLACMIAKTNRLPQQLGSGVEPHLGEQWSMDCVGPISPPTMYGATKFYLFVEHCTTLAKVFLVREDTTITMELALKDIISFCTRHNRTIKTLRFDAGSVSNSALMTDILQQYHITPAPAAPEQQQQNFSERTVQTIYKRMAANFADQLLLGLQYWGDNVKAVVDLMAILPNTKCPHSSPWKEFTGLDPDITSHKFKFGQPGVSSIVGNSTITPFDISLRPRTHQDAKNEFVVAIGQPQFGSNQSVLVVIPGRRDLLPLVRYHFTPITGSLPDITQTEQQQLTTTPTEQQNFIFKSRAPDLPLDSSYIATIRPPDSTLFPSIQQHQFDAIQPTTDLYISPKRSKLSNITHSTNTANSPNSADSTMDIDCVNSTSFSDSNTAALPVQHRRHRSGIVSSVTHDFNTQSPCSDLPHQPCDSNFPTIFSDTSANTNTPTWNHTEAHNYIQSLLHTTPRTFVGGVRKVRTDAHPLFSKVFKYDYDAWKPAIDKEFATIKERGVYEVIQEHDIPRYAQILQLMMDCKIKIFPDGTVEKKKGRLLVDGSKERQSLEETYSPTALKDTILFFVCVAILLSLFIHEADVEGAFLYSVLHEPVYCRLPSQFRDANGCFIFWKLLKSLYGMRRAPRNFFDTLVTVLLKGGYAQSIFDKCLFHLIIGDHLFILVFWVDNMYYFATDNQMIIDFERILKENFKITTDNDTDRILGMQTQSNTDGSKTILMPSIIDKLTFSCFGTNFFSAALTPMSTTFTDAFNDNSPLLDSLAVTRQRKILGLILQVVPIRADVANAHSKLATRITRATEADFKSICKIVQYLAFTSKIGLTFHPSDTPTSHKEALIIDCYADYAHNCHSDSKGHYGIGIHLGSEKSGFFFAKSGKLPVVTDSTAAGEILCGVKVCKYFDWFNDIIKSLGISVHAPTKLHSDNDSMRSTCSQLTASTKRLRHVLLHINFIFERVQAGLLECVRCPTTEMTIDGLTKPLPIKTHWYHLPKLLGQSEEMTRMLLQVERIRTHMEELPQLRWRGAEEHLAIEAAKLQQPPQDCEATLKAALLARPPRRRATQDTATTPGRFLSKLSRSAHFSQGVS